jgi:hypothetical protein
MRLPRFVAEGLARRQRSDDPLRAGASVSGRRVGQALPSQTGHALWLVPAPSQQAMVNQLVLKYAAGRIAVRHALPAAEQSEVGILGDAPPTSGVEQSPREIPVGEVGDRDCRLNGDHLQNDQCVRSLR